MEDEWMVAEHITMMLEDLGCSVAGPVASIEEALALVEAEAPDGVLLDANLNGESSAPIATFLHARAIPFVVVTGYGGLDLPTEVMNAAPRLAKPFSSANFENALVAAFLT
ncbi:MAG: response regulator [Sphingomonas sp.]